MNRWIEKSKNIQALDEKWLKRAREHIDRQTRPQGSLGYLEDVMARLCAIQQNERVNIFKKRVLVFAADHGVETEGVSLYPKEVTQAMVHNFLEGGATVNALARQVGAEVKVIDVGVDADFADHPDLIKAKVRRGSGNIKIEPALSQYECELAMGVGWEMVEQAKRDGVNILAIGEMGIANTTAAAAVIARLLGFPVRDITGRGTGIDEQGRKHKIHVIEQAIAKHALYLDGPLSVIQRLGGLEIAAMTGVVLACGYFAMPVVLDGVVVAAAALAAYQLQPASLEYAFCAHQSQEQGHRFVLGAMNKQPLLNLSMRLGEASGAVLALSLLEAVARIFNEVATFEEAAVANKKEPERVG